MPLDADAQAGACPAGAALDAPVHAPSGRCGEPLIAAAGARPEARQICKLVLDTEQPARPYDGITFMRPV